MKTATLFVVIALVIQTIANVYFVLLNFKVMEYDGTIQKFLQPIFLLISIALLVFFIQLYQKQAKN